MGEKVAKPHFLSLSLTLVCMCKYCHRLALHLSGYSQHYCEAQKKTSVVDALLQPSVCQTGERHAWDASPAAAQAPPAARRGIARRPLASLLVVWPLISHTWSQLKVRYHQEWITLLFWRLFHLFAQCSGDCMFLGVWTYNLVILLA